jgi:gas vesicle protein
MPDFRFGDYEFARHRSNYSTAFGFLAIGLGLGALAALLITPKTGKQVRKDVRRKYEDARDAMGNWSERAGDVWERRQEWAEAARRKAEPVARRFRRG